VIECDPAVSVVVINVADPAAKVPIPNGVAPSRNVTVPVIVPAVVELTVAVNVTLAPTVDGFADEETLVVVVAFVAAFTTCETAGDAALAA
jgi:hypothetical protein